MPNMEMELFHLAQADRRIKEAIERIEALQVSIERRSEKGWDTAPPEALLAKMLDLLSTMKELREQICQHIKENE